MTEGKLYEDAIKLSTNKNLADVKTLLGWAVSAETIEEKRRHIRRSIELLEEIEGNLKQLRQ